MERRCSKDAQFGNLYRSFMQEYEDLQHMETVKTSSEPEDTPLSATYHTMECCGKQAPRRSSGSCSMTHDFRFLSER